MEIPVVVRRKAEQAGAQGWLADLPALAQTVADEWSLSLGRVFGDGTEALVVEAGDDAVLKFPIPGLEGHELTALRLADGHGMVRLLDETHGAWLLERLGPNLASLGLPLARRHELLCATVAQIWTPAEGHGLPTGADKARWFAAFIPRMWEETGRRCPESVVEDALACVPRREAAHDDGRAVLVHGDVHAWNALRAPDGTFKLVDPDGLAAEPEYDLGVVMREDPVELLEADPRDRARALAARTGLDATAIWEWGVLERLATALYGASLEMEPHATLMLRAAERCSGLTM